MAEILKWHENLIEEAKTWTLAQQGTTLFLEPHPEYPAYLLVNSLDPLYVHTLKDVIGEYRSISRLKINELLDRATEEGYDRLYYLGAPEELNSFIKDLDTPYPEDLNVTLKQFQVRGFNYTKDLPSSIINWSTGTGKSVYSVARAKYLLNQGKIDKVIVLSKSHNKINWKRTFDRIGDLRAEVDDDWSLGSTAQKKRESRSNLYLGSQIIIINYEKLRFKGNLATGKDASGRKRPDSSGDGTELLTALQGQRVLWVWDEMPNKMKSMNTGWYKGAEKILKKTKKNFQIELTAKKLDTNPENVYACTKILDKTIWPNIATFRQQYAKSMSSFSPWQVASWDSKKLPELGMRLAHITHIANKYTDPDIRAEFPEDHWEDVIIDMSPQDRKLYDAITDGVKKSLGGKKDYAAILETILPLQLMCNNPDLINKSQGKIATHFKTLYTFSDKNCAKLDTLHDMLDEIEGKIVIFTMYNDFGVKMLSPYLNTWGVNHVAYTGNNKAKQIAQDRFTNDKRVKVFLSSDAGSDSIDLEQATTVINYDLPWNHSTLIQRVNRISRLTSSADHVFYYNFITADTLEERKLSVLERKRLMEEAIDQPLGELSEAISSTSLNELLFIVG